MELKFGHIEASEKKAVLFLKGAIGDGKGQVNGDLFADEMLKASMNYDKIDLYINSMGGSVIQGYSIITAIQLIQDSGKELRLINSGVAYSMGGFILASGKEGSRYSYDYATAMIHDPRITGNDNLTEGEKELISKMVDSVATITANKTGQSIEKIRAIMTDEKFLNSLEMKQYGIIDDVITTGKSISIPVNDMAARMAACAELTTELVQINNNNNNQKTTKDMSKINSLLMLNAEASEEAQVQAIADLSKKAAKVTDLEASLEVKKGEVIKLSAKVEALEKETKRNAAELLVGKAIEEGKINAESKELFVDMAMNDMGKATNLLKAIVSPTGSINAQLEAKGGNKNDSKQKAEEYKKLMEDPEKMAEMDAKTLDDMEAAYKKVNGINILTVE